MNLKKYSVQDYLHFAYMSSYYDDSPLIIDEPKCTIDNHNKLRYKTQYDINGVKIATKRTSMNKFIFDYENNLNYTKEWNCETLDFRSNLNPSLAVVWLSNTGLLGVEFYLKNLYISKKDYGRNIKSIYKSDNIYERVERTIKIAASVTINELITPYMYMSETKTTISDKLKHSRVSNKDFNIIMKKNVSSKNGTCYMTLNTFPKKTYKFDFMGEPTFMRFFNDEFCLPLLLNSPLADDISTIRETMKTELLKVNCVGLSTKGTLDIIDYYKSTAI